MMSSFAEKKKRGLKASQKVVAFLLVLTLAFTLLVAPLKNAKAQIPVTDLISNTWTIQDSVWNKIKATLKILLQKVGSIALQQAIRNGLNKIAYDTATWIGSGAEGQKPMYVTEGWDTYMLKIGDEAAGDFLESFVQNLSATVDTDCGANFDACDKSCREEKDPDKMGKCLDRCGKTLDNCTEAVSNNSCVKQKESCLARCQDDKNFKSEDEMENYNNLIFCNEECKTTEKACLKSQAPGAQDLSSFSPSFNVCQPSSIEAKLRIGLGLANQNRAQGPNCTASEMVKAWGLDKSTNDKKLADWSKSDFLETFSTIFDPRSNDMGIYMTARSDLSTKVADSRNIAGMNLTSMEGWLNTTDIAGNLKGTPGEAKNSKDKAEDMQTQSFGKVTGDILIDTANVFLNQLALSYYQRVMKNLSNKAQQANSGGSGSVADGGNWKTTDSEEGDITYGEGQLKENLSVLLKPSFGVRADYDILSDLSICLDPKNPGPTNCVIDDKFLQGIAEKKTVIEAINEGYLHSDWQLTADTRPDTYSGRNISILRKFRVLPVGWEVAVQKMADNSFKATLMDLVSCFDYADKYTKFSADFNVQNQSWCQGLVDPNWVLKAPLNYCKKEGVGGQILNKYVTPGTKAAGDIAGTLSSLSIVRGEEYCADDQSCIKEKDDGSCEAYGYCNEEKRIWKFNGESCAPLDNTCQSFINPSDGQVVSYLENTLDYGDCSTDSAGCRQYSLFGTYASSTGAVTWSSLATKYFNKHLGGCREEDEGCSEFLRLKPTWGSNLVINSDFQDDQIGDSSTAGWLNNWPIWSSGGTSKEASIVDSYAELGGAESKILKLAVQGSGDVVMGVYSNQDDRLVPDNLQLIPGYSYTLSADVYLAEGDKVHLVLGNDYQDYEQITDKATWKHMSVTRTPGGTFNSPTFDVVGYDSAPAGELVFYVKNIKLEISDWDTGYSTYGSFKTYEKLLPPYLEQSCYQDVSGAIKDYRLKSSAPEICSNYARRCNKDEVGCELYFSVKDVFAIPAKVTSGDYCAADCLGYDVYISKASYFNSPRAENLIPEKTQACRSAAVGCNAFTNLDTLEQGGEQLEYYSELKQCIQPNPTACGSFYAWEGTESGYQLKVYQLQKAGNEPAVTSNDQAECSAAIFRLPISHPDYNPDCQEFYNVDGEAFYHLLSRTITCSTNCHPYRIGENNIDASLSQVQCSTGLPDRAWHNNACVVCLNGGLWNDTYKACVYQAIPGEGKLCTAEENGCREYNGSDGSNVRLLGSYDFESGLNGWHANCTGGVSIEPIANAKDGHSLKYNDDVGGTCASIGFEQSNTTRRPLIERALADSSEAAQLKVGDNVREGAAYTIKFLARSASPVNIDVYFLNTDSDEEAHFQPLTISGANQWNVYQINLDNLDHAVSADKEFLVITGDGDVYFDNFVITEITDRYYLIKDTSQIPDICYYDIFDNYQGPDYNLGCSQYTDRGNLSHNLRQFSQVCSEASVGCEQLIATQNYTSPRAGIWRDANENGLCDSDEPDCVTVPEDSALYAVFDQAKQCNSADLGCSRLGQNQNSGSGVDWTDVFQKNNPNQYDQILCGSGEVGCEEWPSATSNQSSYFKNPGNNTCVYREGQDPANPGKAWYKIPVKRCDANSDGLISGSEIGTAVCASLGDCNNKPCIVDNNDYLCTVSYFKTFGFGGSGNQVPVPDGSVGLCSASKAGCTEYLDPVSQFSPNLLYNSQMLNGAEGWENNSLTYSQTIKLDANKLYIFNVKPIASNPPAVELNFPNAVKPLLIDNSLGTSTPVLISNSANRPIIFHSLNNSEATVEFTSATPINSLGGPVVVEVRSLVIDYQNKNDIDRQSCNGKVEFDNGCVLFNERSVNGSQGLFNLQNSWDAYATLDRQAPAGCDANQAGSCNANQLIKVRPDRVCAKWFDCLTYVKDPETNERTCYAIGECDRLNDKNECANFLTGDQATSTHLFSSEKDKNSSGYALVDKYYFSQMKEVGLNAEARFDFEDVAPALNCTKLVGSSACEFPKGVLAEMLVREPEGSPTDYPAQGKNFLKIPAAYQIMPHSSFIPVAEGKDYYLSYLVNTKGFGLTAEVVIQFTDQNGANISGPNGSTSTDVTADLGWERRVFKFSTSSGVKGIKILLRTTTPDKQGYVYFDDLRIESVLKIGDNQYATKECRLYPTNDSLTCTNKNENIIQDGIEGYCLEHDPDNPGVCLLWYPIDQISSNKSNRSNFGYQGKFPLNYCTSVDGNFELVEKRVTTLVAAGCVDGEYRNDCFGVSPTPPGNWRIATNSEAYKETGSISFCGWNATSGWGMNNYYYGNNANLIKYMCGADAVIGTTSKYFVMRLRGYGYNAYFCVPSYISSWQPWRKNDMFSTEDEIRVSATMCNNNNQEELRTPNFTGWYRYDGLDNNLSADIETGLYQIMHEANDYCNTTDHYCYDRFDEAKNANPPVRVYDYIQPPYIEDKLKLIADSDAEKVYNLTCDRFTQTVDSSGENKAWVGRTGINSTWVSDTPPYFIDSSNPSNIRYYGNLNATDTQHFITKYGRNREAAPFGAAVWPDDFDLLSGKKIEFRDQYSDKNNEEIFAGRPYGCEADFWGLTNEARVNKGGCPNIGYCSADPSVYCLYSPTGYDSAFDVNTISCRQEGYGTCLPLWDKDYYLRDGTPSAPDDIDILKTLFLRSYNNYSWESNKQVYINTTQGAYEKYLLSSSLPACPGNVRLADNYGNPATTASFCAVYPIINSVQLKYNGIPAPKTNQYYTVDKRGIYSLEFNSIIDPEQEPLSLIYIDWGDGSEQIITGQNSHPVNPHVFYHFYQNTGDYVVRIAIYDNWRRYDYYCTPYNNCVSQPPI